MKMTRIDFIKFMRRRYYLFFENIPEDDTIKEYCLMLKPEWDFDKLQELFLDDYDNMRTPPPANYFKKFAGQVKTSLASDSLSAEKKNALTEVTEFFNSDKWQKRRNIVAIPDTIRLLINKYKITAEMINDYMISEEFQKRATEF